MQPPLAFIFVRHYTRATMKITTSHRLYMKAVEARRAKINKMKQAGMKWTEIAKALGVTRQRVQQIAGKKL